MSVDLGFFDPKLLNKLDAVVKKLKNYVVSFDIDGVEVNSASAFVKKFNKQYKTHYKVNDLETYWSFVEWVQKAEPENQNFRQAAMDFWNAADVNLPAPPVAGAWLMGQYLHQNGVKIHRISSRPGHVIGMTKAWYQEKMPWVDLNLIHIEEGSPTIREKCEMGSYKVRMIKELGIQFHFDDSLDEAVKIVKETDANVVLVPQPWNLVSPTSLSPKIILLKKNENSGIPKLVSVFLNLFNYL